MLIVINRSTLNPWIQFVPIACDYQDVLVIQMNIFVFEALYVIHEYEELLDKFSELKLSKVERRELNFLTALDWNADISVLISHEPALMSVYQISSLLPPSLSPCPPSFVILSLALPSW